MKIVNLKNSLIALLSIGMVMVSCGGGGSKQQSAEQNAQEATDKMVKQAASENDFTAAGKAKIASLGKSEKDKRLVVRSDDKDGCEISVYEWKNGDYLFITYTFFYSSKKEKYDRICKSRQRSIVEKDDNALWYREDYETSAKSWQERYSQFKDDPDYKGAYTIVE